MLKLKNEVEQSVENELSRACEKFGALNHSHHESYAVILEEIEEAREATEAFIVNIHTFWGCVKQDKPADCLRMVAEEARTFAIKTAMEWVQVAAMCEKARLTAEYKLGQEERGVQNAPT